MGILNLLLSAMSPLPYMQVNPKLHALLFCWHQEASLPMVDQSLLPSCHMGELLLPCQRVGTQLFH
jgi:hypothetical protein